MTQSFDAIIVGGGIMGCSTALQLVRRGLKVVLLEKGSIGNGPTGSSSAIIRQHYSNVLTARMALYSLKIFQDFAQQVGGESGFNPVGFLMLVDKKDREGLEANIAMQRGVGIDTRMLSATETREIMPTLDTSDEIVAAYEPGGGYADPYLTVTSYANAAKAEGVKILQDTTVTDVRFADGKVVGVDSTAGQFSAPLVLNCSGAWAGQVAKMAGVDVPINACRIQISVLQRPSGYEAAHAVVADFVHASYFRPETGNLTLVGLIDPTEADAIVDPDKFRTNADDDFVLDAGERMIARFPVMEDSRSQGGYASLYAITPDWHPIVDELIEGSGFYVCSGFSGHGFKLGPAVGRMFADLVTKVEEPLFDAGMFRFSRFAENKPVRSQYEYSIVG